jgi:hypothetical protein
VTIQQPADFGDADARIWDGLDNRLLIDGLIEAWRYDAIACDRH